MARPSKYRKEFPKIVDDYVKECVSKNTIPWVEEVARIIGVHTDTITNWQESHKGFFRAIKELMDRQAIALKTVGLKRGAAMSIFLLKANHGYIETERVQHEGRVEVEVVRMHLPPKDKKPEVKGDG